MPPMRMLVERVRYLAVVGVLFGLLAALAAFGWGGYKTLAVALQLVRGDTHAVAVQLVQIMDAFLIASALLLFAVGLYELFVEKVTLPEALAVEDFDGLKHKLIGVIVLVMAVSFVERLETEADPGGLLYTGLAVALVSAPLILYGRKR